MRIGVLSDTHLPGERRTLWDEVRAAFAGVDLILHGGDIVSPSVLDWLEEIAPVSAAQGNNDLGWTDPRMAPIQWLEVAGWRLVLIHDMEPEERPIPDLVRAYLKNQPADIIITGHTHYERLDYRDDVLQLNPGSPTLPHLRSTRLGTVGLFELGPGRLDARVVRLGETEGRPNPGLEFAFSLTGGIRDLGDSMPRVEPIVRR
jgi:uncharacterized protein